MENKINVNELKEQGKTLVYPQKEELWNEFCEDSSFSVKTAINVMKFIDNNELDKALMTWNFVIMQNNMNPYLDLPISEIFNIVVNFSKKGPEFYEKVLSATPDGVANQIPAEVLQFIKDLKAENAQYEKELAEKAANNNDKKSDKPKEFGEE